MTRFRGVMQLTYRAHDVGSEPRDTAEAEMRAGITPETIRAGVSALEAFEDWLDVGPTGAENLVRAVLEASLPVFLEDRFSSTTSLAEASEAQKDDC